MAGAGAGSSLMLLGLSPRDLARAGEPENGAAMRRVVRSWPSHFLPRHRQIVTATPRECLSAGTPHETGAPEEQGRWLLAGAPCVIGGTSTMPGLRDGTSTRWRLITAAR